MPDIDMRPVGMAPSADLMAPPELVYTPSLSGPACARMRRQERVAGLAFDTVLAGAALIGLCCGLARLLGA